jgi:hypothetical protein
VNPRVKCPARPALGGGVCPMTYISAPDSVLPSGYAPPLPRNDRNRPRHPTAQRLACCHRLPATSGRSACRQPKGKPTSGMEKHVYDSYVSATGGRTPADQM